MMKRKPNLICLLIIGEDKTGKTTLRNHLVDVGALPASPHQHTAQAVAMFDRNKPSHRIDKKAITPIETKRTAAAPTLLVPPNERLRMLQKCVVVDIPADSPLELTRNLTDSFSAIVPIMCSRATQILPASQISYWVSLPISLRKNGILAVTFCDLLTNEKFEKIVKYVSVMQGHLFPSATYTGRSWNPPDGITSVTQTLVAAIAAV